MKKRIFEKQMTSQGGPAAICLIILLIIGCGKQKDPFQPETSFSLLGTFSTLGYAHQVYVAGAYAYVVDDQAGVWILDVSDPEEPSLVTTLGEDQSATNVEGVHVLEENKMALVADYDIGILIYDIADMANPQLLNVAFDRDVEGVFGIDKADTIFVFAADRNEGFKVNRYEKRPEGDWNWFYYTFFKRIPCPYGDALDVAATEYYAFVANDHIGLEVIDLSLPDSSAHVKTVDTPGDARAVSLWNGYAYLAAYQRGVQIIDVSVPADAEVVGSYEEVDRTVDVFAMNDYAYVADRDVGLLVLDVSVPEQPSRIGWVETPYAQAVFAVPAYSGNHIDIYLADRDWGLVIIRQKL
jgi:hypothetical protein